MNTIKVPNLYQYKNIWVWRKLYVASHHDSLCSFVLSLNITINFHKLDLTWLTSLDSWLVFLLFITVPPQILHSSDCTKTTSQINCSCETVGNPSPILHWYLNGLPVNHSDRFTISSESLNVTGLRTIITVNQSQWRDLSTLVCHSSNSLGTASQRFCTTRPEQQTSAGSHGLSYGFCLYMFVISW